MDIWGIICRNCTWLLNNVLVNLIENVQIDFLKKGVSTVPFPVSTDTVPYL